MDKTGRGRDAGITNGRVKGAGQGREGEDVLRQEECVKEENVSQQGEHGEREDRGEEEWEDKEAQEEETDGEKTGEKTEEPQEDGPGSQDSTWRRSGNQDGTKMWKKGQGRYDQASFCEWHSRKVGNTERKGRQDQASSGQRSQDGSEVEHVEH